MQLDIKQLRELLLSIHQTDITELILKGDDFELTVRRGRGDRLMTGEVAEFTADLLAQSGIPNEEGASVPLSPAVVPSSTTPPPTVPVSPPSPLTTEKQWVDVVSPMVGTFYRSPAPGEAPFVSVGDRIKVGQTVCIIEAMKLMNEIEAEVAGEVKEVLMENGQPVEYGQVLLRVQPL